MIPVLFALISAVGAWAAWRRNPLYSTRSTLRSAAYVLLAIAAVIGLVVGAVNLVINRSPVVAGVTLGVVIIFGTLALIFIIQSVSTPKEAKLATELPPTAKLVHVHRQKVYQWAKVFAISVVILGVLAIALPGNGPYVIYAVGSVVLLLGLVMLPVGYLNAMKFDRSLTALMCDPWVHWQYSAEEWKQWTEVQAARVKATPSKFILKRDWRKVVWPFSFIVLGVFIFSPGTWLLKTLYILGCYGLILPLMAVGARDSRRAPETLRAALLKANPEAYFGRDGLYCNGIYTTWVGISVYLTSAAVDHNPPRSLYFRFEKYIPNPYGGSPTLSIDQIVPIPAGGESDIARLQQELTSRCPKAQIALS
jgi:hypothetical protein